MIKVDLKSLIARLDAAVRIAMEEAAGLCVSNGHREVAVEHFLTALLGQPGADCRVILQACDADPDGLRNAVKASFERFRQGSGSAPVLSPLLVELLQDAWMIASLDFGMTELRSGPILLVLIENADRYARFEYGALLERLPADHIRRKFSDITAGSVETPKPATAAGAKSSARPTAPASESALDRFAMCFTQAAREGRVDPVFCRDDEIRQIVDILARRRKNNPICVGEAGVGKTAVVEGLALKIVEGDVPDSLIGAEVWGLDMGALQAGASVKGEFEKRLKGVLEDVKNADKQTILFIDEAHTLVGAGGPGGGGDAANLLKPALARGEIKTIAATTWSEYKKYFEKDPALTRRFQLVKLDEPSVEQARIIIQGLAPNYEKAHGVYISDAGVEAAARLSARYITGRQLPDKAIDVLDTACARVKVALDAAPAAIERLRRREQALLRERQALERDRLAGHEASRLDERLAAIDEKLKADDAQCSRLERDLARQKSFAAEVRALQEAKPSEDEKTFHLESLRRARAAFEAERRDNALVSLDVGPTEIAAVIADWTGIPVSTMTQDEVSRLLSLAKTMGETVHGQDHALRAIENQLQSSKLDLQNTGRPLGVFLLAGPSGVGKTETALEVARRLFGGEQYLTTVNMTEYQEKHALSRLIGSPPGYVGYGEGGVLTEAIRKKPYSVVLLDEVEKADPDILNLFYQAFDKGEMNDGEGRAIDCKNVVFFLTSNLASEEIGYLSASEGDRLPLDAEEILDEIRPILSNHFKPALLARMQPLVYMPLTGAIMSQIVEAKLKALTQMLKERQAVELTVSEAARERVQALCTQTASGARLVDQVIQRRILPIISREILNCGVRGDILEGVALEVAPIDDLAFTFVHAHDVVLPKLAVA